MPNTTSFRLPGFVVLCVMMAVCVLLASPHWQIASASVTLGWDHSHAGKLRGALDNFFTLISVDPALVVSLSMAANAG